MSELQDYSGPLNPDIKFEDFSKDFLIRMIRQYARGYMKMGEFWYDRVVALVGEERAMREDAIDVWIKQPYFINPKVAKAAGIEVKCVVDVLKVWQLLLDGFLTERYIPEFDVRDPDHVVMSIVRCNDLYYYQNNPNMKGRIELVCGARGVEQQSMEGYIQCFLPNAQVKQLAGPEGSGIPVKEGCCCQWELTNK